MGQAIRRHHTAKVAGEGEEWPFNEAARLQHLDTKLHGDVPESSSELTSGDMSAWPAAAESSSSPASSADSVASPTADTLAELRHSYVLHTASRTEHLVHGGGVSECAATRTLPTTAARAPTCERVFATAPTFIRESLGGCLAALGLAVPDKGAGATPSRRQWYLSYSASAIATSEAQLRLDLDAVGGWATRTSMASGCGISWDAVRGSTWLPAATSSGTGSAQDGPGGALPPTTPCVAVPPPIAHWQPTVQSLVVLQLPGCVGIVVVASSVCVHRL
jgi:hypothetical protein